ncbi:hypothetical protein RCA23_c10290 [Planktomarina temperata RCA23]|uniref:Uncharacterized protein n=1 Tax=Planktomarina temperata RCA23 TaxID=666509 RepID=A0AAN0RI00_9RHOB|nr:hypothetical protein RCA23_c10290 [Planktomarina temperata RCA23]
MVLGHIALSLQFGKTWDAFNIVRVRRQLLGDSVVKYWRFTHFGSQNDMISQNLLKKAKKLGNYGPLGGSTTFCVILKGLTLYVV